MKSTTAARLVATAFSLMVAIVTLTASEHIASAGTPTQVVTKTTDTADGACDVDCSLREAIIASNADGNNNDIIQIPSGVYVLSRTGIGEDSASTGDLDLRYIMTIEGAGQDLTIIQGDGADRIFETFPGSMIELHDLTIQGGGGGATIGEGGILSNGFVKLVGVTVRNNVGVSGAGGIKALSDLDIQNSRIVDNTGGATASAGGVIASGGGFSMFDVEVAGNIVSGSGAAGGIFAGAASNIFSDVTITNNVATGLESVGGLFITGASGDIRHVTITNNVATGNDSTGGFRNNSTATAAENLTVSSNRARTSGVGGIFSTSSLTIDGVTVFDNVAGDGGVGGVASTAGGISLTNAVIVGNEAAFLGVGGFVNNSLSLLTHATIVNNKAKFGGTGGIRPNAALNVQGSLIALNKVGDTTVNCSGPLVSGGHNIEDEDTCGLTSGTDQDNTDPMFGFNPGDPIPFPLPIVLVLEESPVIDGDPSCPPPDDDVFGVERPEGEACDIGAYEYNHIFPSQTPSLVNLIWGDDDCDGDVDPEDVLEAARVDAGLAASATGDCPTFGTTLTINGFPPVNWSDIDCNGTTAAADWLRLIRYAADVPAEVPPSCPGIGFQFHIPSPAD